jgi:ABC-type Fe3+-siderophore transport system permease subunit
MFRELLNFSYQRNWLQAVGWYLISLIIGIALAVLVEVGRIAVTGAAASFWEGFNRGHPAGQIVGIFYVVLLAVLLLWRRPKDAPNTLLAIAGVALDAFFGTLGGLLPLAVLTTRPPWQKP